ncbi:MAG: Crp/Fnr family transcriptional regulator [Chloroflexi bacterium]|nr:MAG: Crp/Fnr family transcriptional regulator [Chloroflexota bacterium]
MPELFQLLADTPVFSSLPKKELQNLASFAVPRKLQPGEFLCHQGDIWPNLLYLLEGELRWAILSVSGREQVLFLIQSGKTFWGHSIFDGSPMPASLSALKASSVYIWTKQVILPILDRHPQAHWEINRMLVATMRQAREIIYGLAFKPVASRLAALLLDRTSGQMNQPVHRDLTLSEIASMVASSQEVVCRLLYQFRSEGIIEIDRASITIQNAEALENLINAG